MTTSKSPRRVFQVAYEAACQALLAYRHRFSPKKFTQPQLLACLVLKEFSRLDYFYCHRCGVPIDGKPWERK